MINAQPTNTPIPNVVIGANIEGFDLKAKGIKPKPKALLYTTAHIP